VRIKSKLTLKYWPFVLVVSLFLIGHVCGTVKNWLLASDYAQATAELIGEGPKGGFVYRYEVNHKVFTGEGHLNRELAVGTPEYNNVHHVGAHTTVYYVRSWPSISSLQTPPEYRPNQILISLGIFLLLLWLVKSALTREKENTAVNQDSRPR
jgi:hypothetical protein